MILLFHILAPVHRYVPAGHFFFCRAGLMGDCYLILCFSSKQWRIQAIIQFNDMSLVCEFLENFNYQIIRKYRIKLVS